MNHKRKEFGVALLLSTIALAAIVVLPSLSHAYSERDFKTILGKKNYPLFFATSLNSQTVDKSVTVNVGVNLSADTDLCAFGDQPDTGLYFIDSPSNQTIPANSVQVTGGPFAGQSVPIQITPGKIGTCLGTNPVTAAGSQAQFQGSKAFDTTGLTNGQYVIDLRIQDDHFQVGTKELTFTVSHPAPTVNIRANGSNGPITVPADTAVNLAWSSTNADSCYASNAWAGTKSLNGTFTTAPLAATKPAYVYGISCKGPGGTAYDSVGRGCPDQHGGDPG